MFFVAKYNPEPKRKINSINDVVSITIGLLILRCDEERKEKLLTCAMEIEVEGRSLSVIFYLLVWVLRILFKKDWRPRTNVFVEGLMFLFKDAHF